MKSIEFYIKQKGQIENLFNLVSNYLRDLELSEEVLKLDQKELNKNTFEALSNVSEGVRVYRSSSSYTKSFIISFPWKDRAESYSSLSWKEINFDKVQVIRVEKNGKERNVFSERRFREEVESFKNYIFGILTRIDNTIKDYESIQKEIFDIKQKIEDFNLSVSEKYISEIRFNRF